MGKMAGRLRRQQHLARLLAEINSGKGRAQSKATSNPSSPSQSHPQVLNRRRMPPGRKGLHPEALDPTRKRHVLICFQKFKPCSSTEFWHLDRQ